MARIETSKCAERALFQWVRALRVYERLRRVRRPQQRDADGRGEQVGRGNDDEGGSAGEPSTDRDRRHDQHLKQARVSGKAANLAGQARCRSASTPYPIRARYG